MSAALAFQQAARAQLAIDAGVAALVPAANILDTNQRPEAYPAIRIGENQELAIDPEAAGAFVRVHGTMHVWDQSPGLASVQAICGAMKRALHGMTWELGGFKCYDQRFESSRAIRDPDGEHSHGIITFQAVIGEL